MVTKVTMAANGKRAAAADLLSSLDAAFAAAGTSTASKYTSQAAVRADQARAQQAFAHKRKRSKKGGSSKTDKAAGGNGKAASDVSAVTPKPAAQPASDPLYARLSVNLLTVGLKDCSLKSQAKKLGTSGRATSTVLKTYIEAQTAASGVSAVDKLKNKVLQLDNPVRTTDATRRADHLANAQMSKLLSARQRRRLGLHLLQGDMPLRNAEMLSAIWTRYARDQFGNDITSTTTDANLQQSARVRAKLNGMDLSGCPIEVTRSRNPSNIGMRGIVMAETQRLLQVCCFPDGRIRSFPKCEIGVRISLEGTPTCIEIDSEWLAARNVVAAS